MANPDSNETPPETDEGREAEAMGERTDLGHKPDGLQDTLEQSRLDRALSGSDSGSDTRAGSLRGGSASGSDNDPDSDSINASLAEMGQTTSRPVVTTPGRGSTPIKNTGEDEAAGDEADAATG